MSKIFYSWQADHPAKTGRNLVHRALEDAINQLNSDADVEDAQRDPVSIDRDTQGVPGSPPIVETIFRKIDEASVFVADLTFVGTRVGGKPTPNPNVAIEYGYALKALSHSRIVAVMNAVHGEPTRDSLPFDLGHMRFPLTYACADDADDDARRQERKRLAASLKVALKVVLDSSSPKIEEHPKHIPMGSVSDPRFRSVGSPLGVLHDGSVIPRPDVEVRLVDGPSMWLRVMPIRAYPSRILVTELRKALIQSGKIVSPLNGREAMNMYGVRGEDGYGLAHGVQDGLTRMVLFAFASGEIWSVDALTLTFAEDRLFFNEANFTAALVEYADVLKRLGIPGPYQWIAGLDGVKNRSLYVEGRRSPFTPPRMLRDSIVTQGEYSGESSDASEALERFMAEVFDAAHLTRS